MNIALPEGYRVEAVAVGLTFPTGVAFDDEGRPYVIEAGYSYGEVFSTPRLLRVNPDGALVEIARGSNGPWTGAAYTKGGFYVAEGGQLEGGEFSVSDAMDPSVRWWISSREWGITTQTVRQSARTA